MKFVVILIFFSFLSCFSVSSEELKIDNIVAVVNDQIILESDVNKLLFLLKKESKDIRVPLRSNFLKDKIINQLIINQLILEKANSMNIIITDEQINDIFKKIAFKENITVSQLKKNITADNVDGYFEYLQNIKKFLKIKIIENHVLYSRIHISKNEVNFLFNKIIKNQDQFKKINVSCMLFPFSLKNMNSKIQEKKILVEKIVNKLKKGYDFDKLYQQYKEKNHIILVNNKTLIGMNDLKKNFLNKIKIFKKQQILGPLFKENGFYIFKINDIKNSNEEIIKDFYIQHCLIQPSIIFSDEKAKKTAFKIYENIKNGIYTFDYAVKKFSHDVYSFDKKGDLGWISNTYFYHHFYKMLNNCHNDQISSPIKSHLGWHIIKLIEKRKIDQYYKKERNLAYRILWNQKMMLEKDNWIKHLKNMAYIKIMKK